MPLIPLSCFAFQTEASSSDKIRTSPFEASSFLDEKSLRFCLTIVARPVVSFSERKLRDPTK